MPPAQPGAEAQGDVIAFLSHYDLRSEGKPALQLYAMKADPALMLSLNMVRHVLAGKAPSRFCRKLLEGLPPGTFLIKRISASNTSLSDSEGSTSLFRALRRTVAHRAEMPAGQQEDTGR